MFVTRFQLLWPMSINDFLSMLTGLCMWLEIFLLPAASSFRFWLRFYTKFWICLRERRSPLSWFRMSSLFEYWSSSSNFSSSNIVFWFSTTMYSWICFLTCASVSSYWLISRVAAKLFMSFNWLNIAVSMSPLSSSSRFALLLCERFLKRLLSVIGDWVFGSGFDVAMGRTGGPPPCTVVKSDRAPSWVNEGDTSDM